MCILNNLTNFTGHYQLMLKKIIYNLIILYFMKKTSLLLIGLFSFFLFSFDSMAEKPQKITTTFFVNMLSSKDCKKKIIENMKLEEGIKKLQVDVEKQTVIITFMSDENTVSNLLKSFKKMGYTATAMEVSCIGSKEGCLNAIHPESTMK